MNTFFWISYVALWILVVPLIILNLVLFRQLGIFVMGSARGVNQSGIPVGRRLPQAEGRTIKGEVWSTEQTKGHPTLIMFGSPRCKDCAEIMPYLESVARQYHVRPVLLLFAEEEAAVAYAKKLNLNFDVVPASQKLGGVLDIEITPFIYAVDASGVIQDKGLVNDLARLEMYAQAISRQAA